MYMQFQNKCHHLQSTNFWIILYMLHTVCHILVTFLQVDQFDCCIINIKTDLINLFFIFLSGYTFIKTLEKAIN